MGTAVIPGRDTSPVLQPAECIFNKIPLLIQRVVKGKCFISSFSGWHADRHPSGFQRFKQPRCVGEEMLEDGCTLVVADLSFSQQKQDRTPMPATNNMEFGIQATFCSAYKTWRIPFLSRLAAVR